MRIKKIILVKELGSTIHQIRLHKQLTIQYVAKAANISETTLRYLESLRYVCLPSYKILKRIADALGIQRKRLTYPVTRETGRRIRTLRNDCHQSQAELSDRIHKSTDVISHWECGSYAVPKGWIIKLAKYFHVRSYYLMCQSDKKYSHNYSRSQSTISLFPCKTKRNLKSQVVNPLRFALDEAVDSNITILYHGIPLKKSRWDICRRLIKDWYKHETK